MKTLSELRLERGCSGQARKGPARGCRLGWTGQAGRPTTASCPTAALGDMEFVQVFGKAWGVQEHPAVGLEDRKDGPRTAREKCPISPSQRTAAEQIQMLRVGIIS